MNRKAITIYTLAAVLILIALGNIISAGFLMNFWPALTLFIHVLLIIGVIAYFTSKKVRNFFGTKATYLSFWVALAATLGSLFYSEIAGLTPCRLCWFQRIFMYPLPLLLLIAYFYGDDIKKYVLWLASLGGTVAIYHYLSQFITISTSCASTGIDCSKKLLFHYGYITIPVMAATAFILVILLMSQEKEI